MDNAGNTVNPLHVHLLHLLLLLDRNNYHGPRGAIRKLLYEYDEDSGYSTPFMGTELLLLTTMLLAI